MKTLRRRIAEQLDIDLKETEGLSVTNIILTFLIVFSVFLAILETESSIYSLSPAFFFYSEVFLLIVFSIEYTARLWTCIENTKLPTRLKYMFSMSSVFDLIVISSMVVSVCGAEGSIVRLVLLARVLRMLKLGRFSKAMQNIGEAIQERKMELILSLFLAGGALILSATAIYIFEGHIQPDAFGSIPRAMWWSVTALTTVGYGDVIPATPIGKVFAALTALSGVGLIAMPTGILASAFSEAVRRS